MHYSCNCGFHSIIFIVLSLYLWSPRSPQCLSFLSLISASFLSQLLFHCPSHCCFPLFLSLLFSIISLTAVFHYFSHCCFPLFLSLLFSIIYLTAFFHYLSHCCFLLFLSLLFSVIPHAVVFWLFLLQLFLHHPSDCRFPIIPGTRCFCIIPITLVSATSRILIPIPVDQVAMVSDSKLMHPQTLAIYNYARVWFVFILHWRQIREWNRRSAEWQA